MTKLLDGVDILITETSSYDERKNRMVGDGTWQKMIDDEKEGILRQATQGHMGLENIGKLATEAKVKTVVLSHLTRRHQSQDYWPWAEEVKKYFNGEVNVAEDLMEFT